MTQGLQPRIVVEIDLPYCSLTYGVSPCAAVLGTTGEDRCYNTIRTCQDRANFTATTRVLRLCDKSPDNYFTLDGTPITCIPSITSCEITPAIINPGINSGERETAKIVAEEHPDSDALLDKYYALRDYNPLERGTFWARLRARWVDLTDISLRIRRGYAGQDLSTFETRHYVISGIGGGGMKSVTIAARDPFALTDDKKSQAPRASNGILLAGIDADDTSATLSPSGVGDAEYPASGEVCIGGDELCSFTRSGDTLTLVRGIAETEAKEHDAESSVQLVLKYTALNGGYIIADLLLNYAEGIKPEWVDQAAWQDEISTYYGTLFTGRVAKPTGVKTLIDELIAQLPAVFFWDSLSEQFKLYALRPATPDANLFDQVVAGSFSVTEQPATRISEVLCYYAQRDPTKKLDETSNYATGMLVEDSESSLDYVTPSNKTIYSRWIPAAARSAVQLLNATLLERYRDPPRKINFSVWRGHPTPPELGQNVRTTHYALQDASGAQVTLPVQITSVEVTESVYQCTAQEVVYASQDGSGSSGIRYIYIDIDTVDVNLRGLYDSLYTNLEGITELRVVIAAGVYVGSTSIAHAALEVLAADWSDALALVITIDVGGYILGRGGDGANATPEPDGVQSGDGGPAVKFERSVTLTGAGTIGGGGGGGAPWRLYVWQRGQLSNHGYSPSTGYYYVTQAGGAGGAGYIPGNTGASLGDYIGLSSVSSAASRDVGAVQSFSAYFDTYEASGRRTFTVRGGNLGEAGTSIALDNPGTGPWMYGFGNGQYPNVKAVVWAGDMSNSLRYIQPAYHYRQGLPGAAGAATIGYAYVTDLSTITYIGAVT